MKKEKKAVEKSADGDQLETDIMGLKNKIAELTAGWQRTQADFINFKKQSSEARSRLIKSANEDLIYELLPILDNFQLAAKHVPAELESDNWVIGIKQIEKQFESTLKNEGVEKIESLGLEFDPAIHEAIEQVKSDQPEGIIVEEVMAGYKFNGDIIRPAKVKVSEEK